MKENELHSRNNPKMMLNSIFLPNIVEPIAGSQNRVSADQVQHFETYHEQYNNLIATVHILMQEFKGFYTASVYREHEFFDWLEYEIFYPDPNQVLQVVGNIPVIDLDEDKIQAKSMKGSTKKQLIKLFSVLNVSQNYKTVVALVEKYMLDDESEFTIFYPS
jgi:hypothetical protein